MAKNNNLQDFIQDLGDTIRKKKGTTAKINPQNFSSEIESIQTATAPTLQSKAVTPSTSQQKVQPDAGYDGLSDVTVNAVTNNIDANIVSSNIRRGVTILGVEGNVDVDKPDQSKTVTPTTQQQRVFADVGYELTDVTVEAVTSSIDTNIKASNIKDGVSILGVTGTLQEGITPEGTLEITENNTYDVTTYASVDVNVESGSGGEYNIEQVTLDDGTCELKITDAAGGSGGSGGGGSSVGRRYGEFRCVAIDYDGTILKEEWLNEGDVFELPEFPTHDRLVALEWSSPAPIVDNKITVWEGDVNAGVIYDTKSGLTEFDIVLTKATGLTVNLAMDGTKDWGDGSSDTTNTHTYSDYGEYTITCDGTALNYYSSTTNIFGAGNQYQCVEVRVSSKVTQLGSYAFANCYGLRHISFSNKITSWLGTNWFYYCGCLKCVIFPNGATKIGNEAFRLAKTVNYIVFPYGLTSIGTRGLQFDAVLDMAVFPDTMTSGGSYNTFPMSRLRLSNGLTSFSVGGKYQVMYSFNGRVAVPPSITTCPSDKYFADGCTATLDFSRHTVVPTMSSTSFLTSNTNLINGQFKIIVPDALYDEWIAATNWSTFANYIYKASEVK